MASSQAKKPQQLNTQSGDQVDAELIPSSPRGPAQPAASGNVGTSGSSSFDFLGPSRGSSLGSDRNAIKVARGEEEREEREAKEEAKAKAEAKVAAKARAAAADVESDEAVKKLLEAAKKTSSAVTSQLQFDIADETVAMKMVNIAGNMLTPRNIWSHNAQNELVNSNFIKNNLPNKNLCLTNMGKGTGICILFKALIEGNADPKILAQIKTLLKKSALHVQLLELAGVNEILGLRAGLHMGNETYEEWVQKIKNNPAKYGFIDDDVAASASGAAAVEAAAAAALGKSDPESSVRKYLKQRGGANQALDDFLNNHNLQFFIMTFFQFIRVNPAVLQPQSSPAPSAVPAVPANSRHISNFSNFRGGSIIDTILNTHQTIQRGGSQYDMRRIESILNNPIQLYSNQLRLEVNHLKSKLESSGPNHKMDAQSEATLESMLTAISHLENSVLTATLLGHKFLEAHREYENVDDLAKAETTLEKLQQIAALVEHKSDKLKKRNQQIAQTIQLALYRLAPYNLSYR